MRVLALLCSLSAVSLTRGDEVWRYTESHGALMWCQYDQFPWLVGACTSGRYDDCYVDGNYKAQKVLCRNKADFANHAPGRTTYVFGEDHGVTIQCPEGMAARGSCSSGQYKDCKCAGSKEEGCTDQNQSNSHLLMCAEGLDLDAGITEEMSGDRGHDLACPAGYVMYKFCASGRYFDCKNKYGESRNHVVGCMHVRDPNNKPDDEMIQNVVGFWKHIGTFNNQFTYTVSEAVQTTTGQDISTSKSSSYGFSESIGVAVENDWKIGKTTISGTFTANQEVSKSVTTSLSRVLLNRKTEGFSVPCGDANIPGAESLYQWNMATITKDGNAGPVVTTTNYLCSTAGEFAPDRPRCAPGDCVDEDKCDACWSDFCPVLSTGSDPVSPNTFNFERACVDRRIDTDSWDGLQIAVEQVRNGNSLWTGTATLHRQDPYDQGAPGDAYGFTEDWDAGTPRDWQQGDSFRVIVTAHSRQTILGVQAAYVHGAAIGAVALLGVAAAAVACRRKQAYAPVAALDSEAPMAA